MLYKELTLRDKLAIARVFTSNLMGISTLNIIPLNSIGVYFYDSEAYYDITIILQQPIVIAATKTFKLNDNIETSKDIEHYYYLPDSDASKKVKAIMSTSSSKQSTSSLITSLSTGNLKRFSLSNILIFFMWFGFRYIKVVFVPSNNIRSISFSQHF